MGSSVESNAVKSALPSEYKLATVTQAEPSLTEETKAIELAKTVTDVLFNKKDKTVNDIQEEYFQQPDNAKLKDPNDLEYTLSPEYQDYLNRSIRFWAPLCVTRTMDMSLTKTLEAQVSLSSQNKYIVNILIDGAHLFLTSPQWEDINCNTPPSDMAKTEYEEDLIYEYTIVRNPKTNEYKVYDLTTQAVKDLNAFQTQVAQVEKSEYDTGRQLTSTNSFTPPNAEGYNYNEVKNIDTTKVNNIFTSNGPKTVTIAASGPNGMGAASGYGFFVQKGVVATSWDVVEGLLKDDITDRYAVGFDGKLHKIVGIISAAPELDIAFLKLEDDFGDPVTLGDPTKLKTEDPVIVIGSPMGLTPITRVGIFTELITNGTPIIRDSLPLGEGDLGSPLFNLDGEVIGINTSIGTQKNNDDTSLARPTSLFKDLVQKLKNQNFNSISYTSFSDLAKKINTPIPSTSNTRVSQDNNLWKAYQKLPNITQYKSAELTESYVTDGYLLVRYKNTISDFMKTSILIEAYGKKLEEAKFKLIYNNNGRLTYIRGKEIVRIAERYDYISVIYGDQE
jgi:S1-C subfamily serine protease